jgi:hypothetical protein
LAGCSAPFEPFPIPFATTDATAAFDADYVIMAKEPINPIRGKTRFEFLRAES